MLGLNTALTGIRAAQTGLDTASHNVANANTTGYTRQRVVQSNRLPFRSPVGPIGTGTDVTLGRARDAFLDARARAAKSAASYADRRADLLGRSEAILAEPDNGVTKELGELWNAFEDLAGAPADLAARQQVLSALSSTTARIRGISSQWDQLASDSTTDLSERVAEANDLLGQLAELNRTIPTSAGGSAVSGDLLDARDRLVDRLAQTLGTTVTHEPDDTVTLRLGDVVLVSGIEARYLELNSDLTITDPDGVEVDAGGDAGAVQDFLVTDLPAQMSALDEIVDVLVTALNEQHDAGQRPDGSSGGPLLDYDPSLGLARSVFLVVTSPADLAAAGPGPAGAPPAAHDGGNATLLAALRSSPPAGYTRSIDEQLRSVVINVATSVAAAERTSESQGSLDLAASLARESSHGVSLDEEMVALVTYQRALEASARVMTAIDEALNKLVNGTGIVGR